MSEVTNTFRLTIMGLMIMSGAINTIGIIFIIQPTNSKTLSTFTKGATISSSSIPICKYII